MTSDSEFVLVLRASGRGARSLLERCLAQLPARFSRSVAFPPPRPGTADDAFNLTLADGPGLERSLQDASAALGCIQTELSGRNPGELEAELDIGVLQDASSAIADATLPPAFLRVVAECNLLLRISFYPTSD